MSNHKKHAYFTWLAAGTALCALASPAAAQPASAQAPVATADEMDDTIVVTARRREESLLDVPISVSAFSAESIEDRQVQDITDLSDFTPGLQINEAFGRGRDRPVIRGASNILQAEGKVGVFLDGTPFFGDFSSLDLANVERVEIIRGPQSAVFGRGTLAGAVNVVLRRPSDHVEGRFAVTLGNYDRREYGASLSGPLTPWLGVQVGAKFSDVDGQWRNQAVPGERLGDENSRQYMAGLFLDPSPDFSASLRWLHQRDRDSHFAIGLIPASANNCFLSTRTYLCGEVEAPESYGINTNDLQYPGLYRKADRLLGDARWDIGGSGYELTFQAGYNDLYEISGVDQSYDARSFYVLGTAATCNFVPIGNQRCGKSAFHGTTSTDRKTETYEVRLTSPGRDRFRWRLGVYGAWDTLTPTTDYLEATEVGLDLLGDERRIHTKAVFGGIDFDVTETITVGAELRYQEDNVRATTLSYRAGDLFSAAYLAGLRLPNPDQIVGVPGVREATFDAFLPRVTANWEIQPRLTLYAQYAKGNAPGGFNPVDAPIATFAEEKLTNYEVGLRTTRWGFNYLSLGLFTQDYGNQVLTNTYQTPTIVNSYQVNIGRTRSRGLELEGVYPLLGRMFELQFSYAFIDSEIREGIDPEQAIINLGIACKTGTATNLALPGCLDAASVAGNKTPLVSRHTGSVGLRANHDIASGWNLFSGVDLIYRSSFFAQVHNLIETGDSLRVNAQLGVENDQGIRITLWGRNLFGDDTANGILRYLDFEAARSPSGDRARAFAITPSRKAEYGVSASYTF